MMMISRIHLVFVRNDLTLPGEVVVSLHKFPSVLLVPNREIIVKTAMHEKFELLQFIESI